jgi:hypothetical protein
MCRAYSTSPNLPRSGTPNRIKVPHGTVCTRRTRMDRPQYRPGGTAPACYPLKSLIPTSGCFRLLLKPSAHTHSEPLPFARFHSSYSSNQSIKLLSTCLAPALRYTLELHYGTNQQLPVYCIGCTKEPNRVYQLTLPLPLHTTVI